MAKNEKQKLREITVELKKILQETLEILTPATASIRQRTSRRRRSQPTRTREGTGGH